MTFITDPLFYALAVPAVVALGLSKGGFAGVGQMATPMLALAMPPLEAAAILLPIILIQDVVSVWVYRRVWDPWNLKVMLPGAVIGIGAAWLFAAHVSDAAVRLVVGLIALGFVTYAFVRRGRTVQEQHPPASHGVFWGALSGFTTTLIQIGAPPYYAFVLPQRLEKMLFVGTTVMFFAAANFLKIAPYFALGLALLDRLALVELPLAAGDGDEHLRDAVLPVERERDEREPAFGHLADDSVYLAPVQEQLARAERLVVEDVRLRVGLDVHAYEPQLAGARAGVRLGDAHVAVAQRLHLGAEQADAGLELLEDLVLETRLAIGRDDVLFGRFFLFRAHGTRILARAAATGK